jgi:hypothetical protein
MENRMSQVQEAPYQVTPQMQQYHQLLARHDWEFNYADDHRAFMAGSVSMGQLRALQPTVDPYFDIWNIYAPSAHKNEASHV